MPSFLATSPQGERKRIRYYTQCQLQGVFSIIENPRDAALFRLMYRYGLRRSEPGLITVGDIDLARGVIVLPRLKGSHTREYPLADDIRVHLTAWIAVMKNIDPDIASKFPLFPSERGKGISGRRVSSLWGEYVKKSGVFPAGQVPILSVHSLKHSIAVHCRDAGMSLDDIQYLLGHKNRQNTEIYAAYSNETAKRILTVSESNKNIVK